MIIFDQKWAVTCEARQVNHNIYRIIIIQNRLEKSKNMYIYALRMTLVWGIFTIFTDQEIDHL